MEAQQLLRNPDVYPGSEVLAQALADAYGAYDKFAGGLESHGIQLEWRYYADGNAWLAKAVHQWTGARGGQNRTTAFWLSVWNGFFKVSFYIPEKARANALKLPIDDESRKTIADAKPMGKLKFFPLVFELRSDELFETVFTLADFRKRLK